MKISTKGRYGLRAILALARHGDSLVSLSNIAQEENLSLNYLESIFSQMKRADLVTGVTGAQGGYRLAQKPSEITAYQVLHVLEGNMSITEQKSSMPPIRQYLTKHVWTIIDGKVEQILHRVTLQDLLNLAQGKDEV
jgi:Rrf2 family protein